MSERRKELQEQQQRLGKSTCGIGPATSNVELIVKEDILAKAKELAAMISTSTEVDFYKRAEKQIDNNEHVQQLIKAIKKKQKEIVGFEAFGNKSMVDKIEAEIAVLQDELDHIPIVQEFQQSQSDINYLLQSIIGVVKDTVSSKIDLDKE